VIFVVKEKETFIRIFPPHPKGEREIRQNITVIAVPAVV
jgi:hypothetical protein